MIFYFECINTMFRIDKCCIPNCKGTSKSRFSVPAVSHKNGKELKKY